MRFARLLLTVIVGIFLLAAVLYAIPVVSGALDEQHGGEVRPSRPVDRRRLPQRPVATAAAILLPPLTGLGDPALDPADRGRRRRSWLEQALRREPLALRPAARSRARRWTAGRPDGGDEPVHLRHGFRGRHLRGVPRRRVAPRRQGRARRRRAQHVQPATLLLAGRRSAARAEQRPWQIVGCAEAPGAAGLAALRGRGTRSSVLRPSSTMARTFYCTATGSMRGSN